MMLFPTLGSGALESENLNLSKALITDTARRIATAFGK